MCKKGESGKSMPRQITLELSSLLRVGYDEFLTGILHSLVCLVSEASYVDFSLY